MEDKRLVSYLFASANLALLLFAVSFVTKVSAQQPAPKIIIGGESLSAGMAENEAMKKLGNCCSITGGAALEIQRRRASSSGTKADQRF
jgi:hypothetical protein